MRTQLQYLFLLIFTLGIASCGNSKLTKGEAKNQIDQYLNEVGSKTFTMPTYFITNEMENLGSNFPDKLAEAKNQGYLDYETQRLTDIGNNVNVTLLISLKDKINEFVTKQTPGNNSYLRLNYSTVELKSGTYEADVNSLTEPAPDAQGRIVCNVEYAYRLSSTPIYKIFFGDKEALKKTMVFVKMQDGWKIDQNQNPFMQY